jgi:hypothetical protein
MKNLIAYLLKKVSNITIHIPTKNKPQPIICQFCGETGHDMDDCPKSAKFKLFNIDRE